MISNRTGLVGWLGGGPWLVLAECPAVRHNTLTAARGHRWVRGRCITDSPRCVCPRALEMLKNDKENRRERDATPPAKRKSAITPPAQNLLRAQAVGRNGKAPSYLSNVNPNVIAPNMHGAPCAGPVGAKIMAKAGRKNMNAEEVKLAKGLCGNCPIERECGDWALAAEKPAGAWGMVYGGMTVQERKRVAVRRRVLGS